MLSFGGWGRKAFQKATLDCCPRERETGSLGVHSWGKMLLEARTFINAQKGKWVATGPCGGGGAEAKVRLHMLPCLPRDGEDVGKFWAMAANRAGERAPVAFSPTCTRWTPVTSVYCSWNPKYDFCIQNTVHIKTCTGIFMQNYSW